MNKENESIETKNPHLPGYSTETDDDEINLLDLLLVVLKYKKMILITCVATFIVMCGITLLMPNRYTSTARILPPQENQSSLSSAFSGMSGLAGLAGISVGGSSGELYVSMLESRTISDAIIDHFDFIEKYKLKNRASAYDLLNKQVNISLGNNDGIISIKVEDKDPKLAAVIANKYVDELKKMNIRLNLSTAGRERVFLENRLIAVKSDLLIAEENLKSFQEANKAIRIDAQAAAIIDAIAALKAEIANKEVQLGVLLSYQTEQNPQVKELKEAITQLKSQLSKLEESPENGQTSTGIFIATSEVPELGVQYARLLREFKIQETLFELITEQYELAKINEARDTSTIQVIDDAVMPDRKSKPKRSFIVILTTLLLFFLAIFVAFLLEFIERLKREAPDRWKSFRNHLTFRRH